MEKSDSLSSDLTDLELEAVVAGKDYNIYGRPGYGYGGVGGPWSGLGVRPGLGFGGIGGPWSGAGVRPGLGWGAPGLGMRRGPF